MSGKKKWIIVVVVFLLAALFAAQRAFRFEIPFGSNLLKAQGPDMQKLSDTAGSEGIAEFLLKDLKQLSEKTNVTDGKTVKIVTYEPDQATLETFWGKIGSVKEIAYTEEEGGRLLTVQYIDGTGRECCTDFLNDELRAQLKYYPFWNVLISSVRENGSWKSTLYNRFR